MAFSIRCSREFARIYIHFQEMDCGVSREAPCLPLTVKLVIALGTAVFVSVYWLSRSYSILSSDTYPIHRIFCQCVASILSNLTLLVGVGCLPPCAQSTSAALDTGVTGTRLGGEGMGSGDDHPRGSPPKKPSSIETFVRQVNFEDCFGAAVVDSTKCLSFSCNFVVSGARSYVGSLSVCGW